MNIRDLQYLVAVYDLGSFSRAADRCFVSQPTLSGQLKKLEEQLGAPLIERTTRHLFFTPLGEQVVVQAREILKTVEDIKVTAQATQDPFAGTFHLGLIPTVSPYLLPKLMPELSKQMPEMAYFLHEKTTEQAIAGLEQGELDAVILAKLDWSSDFLEFPLFTEEMWLATSKHNGLNDKSNKSESDVNMDILNGESVLMLEDGHCLRDQALGFCFSAGAREDDRFQATSMDTLLHMVASNAGITLVPKLATHTRKDLTFRRFKQPAPSREIVLISRSSSVRQQVLERLAEVVSTVAERALKA